MPAYNPNAEYYGMFLKTIARFLVLTLSVLLLTGAAETVETKKKARRRGKAHTSATVVKRTVRTASVKTHKATVSPRRRVVRSFWTEPTYADATAGDAIQGEDSVIRRAAVEALGPYNGTVVVADPSNGRILTVLNQKLALKSGFQPCSTIKLVAALAALS